MLLISKSYWLINCRIARLSLFPPPRPPAPPPLTPDCRDAFDVPFLQLAVSGNADVLITGDQDLLCLADHFTCTILTAEQFIQTLYS